MRKIHFLRILTIAAITSAVVSTVSGCGLLPREEEVLTPPLAVPEEVTFKTVEVKSGYIEKSIKCSGNFVPVNQKSLFFRHGGGRLKDVYVKVGDSVKQGQVVAELLKDELEKKQKSQEILVESKEKDYTYALKMSEVELKIAEDKLHEIEKSYQKKVEIQGVYSVSEIEDIKNEINNQKNLIEKQKLSWLSQLELKKNDIKTAKLELEAIKQDIVKCSLVSSSDGIVTYTAEVKEGEAIDAFKPIVEVADPKDIQLQYKGNDAVNFELGKSVEITIDGKAYAGEVVLTPNTVPLDELEKYRDTIQFRVNGLPEDVKKGDRAEIKLIQDSKNKALIVPKQAVKDYMNRDVVYVLEDNLRVERLVETGIESLSEVEILSGLEEGESVILE